MPVGRRAWLVAVAVSAALAVGFALLGRWQLERAEQARALRASFAAGVELAPLDRLPDNTDASYLRYRAVELEGRYEPARQFLLDNRVHAGQAGYEVWTPFRATGHERSVLVNRGWVAAGPDRRQLPDVDVGADVRRLRGRIDTLPRPGLVLGSPAPIAPAESVSVVSYPSAVELASALPGPIFDYQLLLDPAAPDGFVRDWRPAGPDPARNVAYAGQWFLLAATVVAIGGTIALRWRRAAAMP